MNDPAFEVGSEYKPHRDGEEGSPDRLNESLRKRALAEQRYVNAADYQFEQLKQSLFGGA